MEILISNVLMTDLFPIVISLSVNGGLNGNMSSLDFSAYQPLRRVVYQFCRLLSHHVLGVYFIHISL